MWIIGIVVTVATAMDLALCAIDENSGMPRFGSRLCYALAVAELCDLVQSGKIRLRGESLVGVPPEPGEPVTDSGIGRLLHEGPMTVPAWVEMRGPRRIDPYLDAVVNAGVVRVVYHGDRKLLAIADAEPINRVARRLMTVLDDPAPSFDDVAFVVLADVAYIARPRLHGWEQHKRRARLFKLRHTASDGHGAPAVVLHSGLKAIVHLSRLADVDERSLDEKIGLTSAARTAGILFG